MSELKDSGIAWVGVMPESWKIKRGKFTLKLLNRPLEKTDDVITCFRDGEVTLRKNRREEGFTVSLKEIGYQGIEPGDLVIHGMDGFAGAIGISDSRGKSSPVLVVCDSDENKRFIMYYLRTMAYNDVFSALATGIRVRSCDLRWNKLAELPYILPSQEEQKRIVSFLDGKCTQIDVLIANVQSQIEKLKAYKQSLITEVVTKGLDPTVPMKDSGVDWIGEIPEHWNMLRIGDVGKFRKGPFGSAIKKEMFVEKSIATYKVYEQKNAIYKDAALGYYYISEEDYKRLESFSIQAGDVIVSCAGTIGESFIIPAVYERGIINQALMRVRLNDKLNPDLFIHIFSCIMNLETPKYSNGSAMKNIPPFNYLLKFLLPYPPTVEQDKIVDYIKQKCSQIDRLIAIKQAKIEKLEQYKRSLIYEYVTGKKEVV